MKSDLNSYPNRAMMVTDLLKNNTFLGLSHQALIEKLGEPVVYQTSKNELVYPISEEYGTDIDPIKITSLRFILNGDSIVWKYQVEKLDKTGKKIENQKEAKYSYYKKSDSLQLAKIYNQLETTPWFKEMQKRQSAHLTILTQPATQDTGNYLLNVGCNAPDRFITYRRFGVQRGSWALEEYK
jgi:hypothetical protein